MAQAINYQFSHAGVCVSDLERSMRFYCDGLGFSPAERYDLDSDAMPGLDRSLEIPGPVTVTSQFIEKDGRKLELLHYPTPAPTGTPSTSRGQLGLTHLSFYVEDVDAAAQHLVDCGGTILPETDSNSGIRLLFLADPDGTRVELMSPPPA